MKLSCFLPGAALSAVLCASALFCFGCSEPPQVADQIQPQPYPTYKVSRQDMTFEVQFSASLKGINDVDIYPQVTGTITEIRMEEGQEVKKNDVLFVIDPIPYEAAYEQAKALAASADATVATAALTKSSMDKLYSGQKAVSYYDMQKAHYSYQAALASQAEAVANVKKAKQDLDNTEVKSPVDGIAGMTSVRVGTLVNPNLPAPMVSVSDNHQIQAYFSISENLLLYMYKAANNGELARDEHYENDIKLKLADGSIYPHTGKLTAMSGVVDKTTGAITCRATFPNEERILMSGGSGSVVIPVIAKGGLVIPQTATFELQDKTFVFLVVDGKTRACAVKLMPADDGHYYVVQEGLKEGDMIVADGVGLLREGVPIDPQPYSEPGADSTAADSEQGATQTAASDSAKHNAEPSN